MRLSRVQAFNIELTYACAVAGGSMHIKMVMRQIGGAHAHMHT